MAKSVALGVLIGNAAALDGQSNQASQEQIERLYLHPDCDDELAASSPYVDWNKVRGTLKGSEYPQGVATVFNVMQKLSTMELLDEEADRCLLGTISVLILYVRALHDRGADMTPHAYSFLQRYAGGTPPSLFTNSSWPLSDELLRKALDVTLIDIAESRAERPEPDYGVRIYVYEPEEYEELQQLTQGPNFCRQGQWGMEVSIHDWFRSAPFRVFDPRKANFFFVPGYAICMFEGGFVPIREIDEIYKRLIPKLKYFKLSGGRDHIFTFGSGMSVGLFKSWEEYIPNSIQLTPETHLFNDFPRIVTPFFKPWRDIAIPGQLHAMEVTLLRSTSLPLSERKQLAVFFGRSDASRAQHPTAGGVHVRADIVALESERLLVGSTYTMPEMYQLMGGAKFCLVPKGKSAWSLRFYEAIFAGCVPILLSDHWELPFEQFIPIEEFVIKWPMAAVGPQLLDYLESLPDAVVQQYMDAGRKYNFIFQVF